MIYYMADFETTVGDTTRVWAWGINNIYETKFEYGNNIDSFMEYVSRESCVCYFHNLKFDGHFILSWLFRHGFEYSEDKKLYRNEFSTLISDMGQWYWVKVKFENANVTFMDSLKLIPLPVNRIPKAYNIQLNKLELDYIEVREEGHELTELEIQYLRNDVMIVSEALRITKDSGMKKMTTSSNALADFKRRCDGKYDDIFPLLSLDVDKDCRFSYKGGWSYVNPRIQGKIVGSGKVYDVNSMYPYVMKNKMLPYGDPVAYNGEYIKDDLYPLFIHCFKARIKIKRGKYPSLQLKHSLYFRETEYIVDSEIQVIFHLTSVDYELMLENYNVYELEHIGGYKFKASVGIFADYVNAWYNQKEQADKEGNSGMKQIAKLYLNGLYGKEGSNPIKRKKKPYYDKELDIVRFTQGKEDIINTGYVPVASFITSWARDIIIRAANACGNRFLYADTDSLHVLGSTPPKIWIDRYELGAFKEESSFDKALYLRSKCYIEEQDGKLDIKLAGLPDKCRDQVNFDTMKVGTEFKGKLLPKVVPGGVVLRETIFKIR